MRFITVGEAIELAEILVGPDMVRSFDLLDSAVARPINYVVYAEGAADIHTAAAHLMYGISRNHPFVDGNKRVSLAAASVFYTYNGWVLDGDDEEVLSLVLDTAEGVVDVALIASRLKDLVRAMELPPDELVEDEESSPP